MSAVNKPRWHRDPDALALVVAYLGVAYLALRIAQGLLGE